MGVNLRLNSIGCEGEYPHKKPRTIDSSMVFSSIVSHRTTHLEEGGPAITVSIPNNWRILLHTFFFKPKPRQHSSLRLCYSYLSPSRYLQWWFFFYRAVESQIRINRQKTNDVLLFQEFGH